MPDQPLQQQLVERIVADLRVTAAEVAEGDAGMTASQWLRSEADRIEREHGRADSVARTESNDRIDERIAAKLDRQRRGIADPVRMERGVTEHGLKACRCGVALVDGKCSRCEAPSERCGCFITDATHNPYPGRPVTMPTVETCECGHDIAEHRKADTSRRFTVYPCGHEGCECEDFEDVLGGIHARDPERLNDCAACRGSGYGPNAAHDGEPCPECDGMGKRPVVCTCPDSVSGHLEGCPNQAVDYDCDVCGLIGYECVHLRDFRLAMEAGRQERLSRGGPVAPPRIDGPEAILTRAEVDNDVMARLSGRDGAGKKNDITPEDGPRECEPWCLLAQAGRTNHKGECQRHRGQTLIAGVHEDGLSRDTHRCTVCYAEFGGFSDGLDHYRQTGHIVKPYTEGRFQP